MVENVALRFATVADAALLAEHRVAMFRDMGSIRPEMESALRDAAATYFAHAIPDGEYVGWIASPLGAPEMAVAGAGVQLRSILPRPRAGESALLLGREGLVLNVYTDREWRRRGIARQMMHAVLQWASDTGIVQLVLHASADGRGLYESLGFVPTNEMRYTGSLKPKP